MDVELSLDGFSEPVCLDRDANVTAKSQGGGVCLYLNEHECKNVLVRESLCTKDVELLAVSLSPPISSGNFPKYLSLLYMSTPEPTWIKPRRFYLR